MSVDSFYTSAGNFTSALNSSVDPRTGLFKVNLPLAKLNANCQLGPELSLNLLYSPLSTVNVGFGIGFCLNLSQYNRNSRKLQLSTGEEYRVGGNDQVKQLKLKSFLFTKLDDGSYQVIHKSGIKERLSLRSGGTYVTTEISSADGRSINLSWDSQFFPARLTQVIDNDDKMLCSIAYPNAESVTTRFTLLPDVADLRHTITLRFRNELLIRVSDDAIDPALVWEFMYDDIGPQKFHRAITEIKAATGLVEKVIYDSEEGMEFPEIAEIPALPRVRQHIVIAGCGQPNVTTTWRYTQKNYLGKDANFNLWQPDTDLMLNILIKDYHYGSTEEYTDDSGNVITAVTRRYNSYHLLVSEVTVRDGKTHTQETEYYAQVGVNFDRQPAQFSLPKTQTETWSDKRDGTNSHSLLTSFEFDEDGNPIRQQSPDGTVTEFTYYPSAGESDACPADPHGFVRYQKSETISPPQICGNEGLTRTKFVWQKLDALHGSGGYAVVQKRKELYKGNSHSSTNNIYHTDRNVPAIYGRVHSQQSIFTPDTRQIVTKFINHRNFTYMIDSDANAFTQISEFIGHDGITTTESQVQNMWTGQVIAQNSSTGVAICYNYDKLGRVTRRTLCPDSIYENSSTWEYVVADDGLYTIENDQYDNERKTRFDFAGRSLSRHRFDTETNDWYELSSVAHNSVGEVVSSTVSDWQFDGAHDRCNRFPLTINISYDGWGEKKTIFFSNNKTQQQNFDYVQRTQTVFEEGGIDAYQLTSASITKTFDKLSGNLINKTVTNGLGEMHSSCQYTWDGVGQLAEERDELGVTTKRTYDEFGRVVKQTLADGTVLSRTYAPHSTGEFVTSISVTGRDANGSNQTWLLGTQKFDSLGRVIASICGGRITMYAYEGALTEPTIITLPSGKKLNYTYIPQLGNVVSTMQTGGITQTFTYDNVSGQLLSARELNAEIQYAYLNDGRLAKETFLNDGSTKVAQHVETLNDTPVTYIDVNGKRTQHIMNAHGQVTRIDDDNLTVDFTYDALARLSTKTVCDKSSSSMLTTKLEYDDFGHECRRTVNDQNGVNLVVSQTYKVNGLLATRTTQSNDIIIREEQFGYDNRNRLIQYQASGEYLPTDSYGNRMIGQNYQFDALNNLTCVTTNFPNGATNKSTYRFENANDPTQLTSVINVHDGSIQGYPARIQLKYDSEGRMISDESGRNLTYDTLGRLRSVTDSSGRTSSYNYDARNRLIRQETGQNIDRSLYYRGAELVNELSVEQESRFIKSGHSCLGIWNGNQLKLTATDHNDSLLWSKNNGNDQFHTWTPYGSGGGNGDDQIGFNGERIDPANGMYNLGNGYRTYNPILMRFNCPDNLSPFGAGGINPYAYCSGDPINYTDPSGHLSWQAIVGIVTGVVSLALAVVTAGASIAAAGGVMAALSSASAVSLAVGTLSVVADVTAIVSGALEDEDPEASAILGWISLGAGVVGLTGSVQQMTKATKSSKSLWSGSKARLQKVEEFDELTPARVKMRGRGNGRWHKIEDGKTTIWASDVEIGRKNVRDFHTKLVATIPKDRRIVILTGVHGDVQGRNYVQRGTDILRRKSLKDFKFTREDAKLIDHRTTVLDIHKLDYIERIQWMCGDYEVILGYCFGRNDQALRYTFDLAPVTSYVASPDKWFG